jgi:hypothetical protein
MQCVHIAYDRYTLDVDLKSIVTAEKLESNASRVEARKVTTVYCSESSPLFNSPQCKLVILRTYETFSELVNARTSFISIGFIWHVQGPFL